MDALSFPFRFISNKAVVISDVSEEYNAQLIASAIMTRKTELPISGDFGSTDPEFSYFDQADLIRTVNNYIQTCRIDQIEQSYLQDETLSIKVKFSMVTEY